MQNNKKRKSQRKLGLTISTLITVVVWAGLEIARSYLTTQVKPDVREQLTALNPTINKEIISRLEGKREISVEEVRNLPAETIPVAETVYGLEEIPVDEGNENTETAEGEENTTAEVTTEAEPTATPTIAPEGQEQN